MLAGGLFGAGIFHLRNREQRKRQAWLEDEVEKRTEDLDEANRRISEQNRQLTELSRTDPLTGLGNRRVLAETLPVEMSILQREARSLDPTAMVEFQGAVVLLMDIDHFKTINDQWGHDAGDVVLKACAEILVSELREGDQAVRWGGEEFVVLSRRLDRSGAIGLAQRVLDCFSERTIDLPRGSTVALSASFGFVQIPLGLSGQLSGEQWQRYIDLADRLLYIAKNRGRGRALGLVWSPNAHNLQAEHDVVVKASNDPAAPTRRFRARRAQTANLLSLPARAQKNAKAQRHSAGCARNPICDAGASLLGPILERRSSATIFPRWRSHHQNMKATRRQ